MSHFRYGGALYVMLEVFYGKAFRGVLLGSIKAIDFYIRVQDLREGTDHESRDEA